MEETTCPVCGSLATLDVEQESTVYCTNEDCNFMGILPDLTSHDLQAL